MVPVGHVLSLSAVLFILGVVGVLTRRSALVIFIGFNLTFLPQFILGYLGMPRRYHVYPDEFQVLHVMSSAGASVLAVGYVIPLIYFAWSLKYGKIAGKNPWGAAGLEWTPTSPPPSGSGRGTDEASDAITSTRRPRSDAADTAVASIEPAWKLALPGVTTTGGVPAASHASSSGSRPHSWSPSASGNPTSSSCAGQSGCGGANHSGNRPSTTNTMTSPRPLLRNLAVRNSRPK